MMGMRMLNRLLAALSLWALVATFSWAQQAAAPAATNTPAVTNKLSTITATVQAVYPDKRSVTLVGPEGQSRAIFVGPDVRLDRIHPGDKVRVSYLQGLAAQIAKGGKTVRDPAAADFSYKNPNAPGGGAGSSVTVSVKILGVNPGTNTVAFEDSDGVQHVIAVKSANMREFIKTLKAGDHVDVTYTESVAISVIPATT
jgi:hypothetical protein